jgi:hypothetical protein
MRPICTISFAALIALAGLSFSFTGSNDPVAQPAEIGKGFAVVELFTSEGCSSCPPADEVAAKLQKEFSGNVYFLEFHVDYWDYIGWKDGFAKSAYTERQREYGETFNLNSVYTPQAVVNGKKELVGSREQQLRTTIQEQLKESSTASVELSAKAGSANTITATYKVSGAGKSSLHIALVQLKAVTDVRRGENAGHQLSHTNIVRAFETVAVNGDANSTINLAIPANLSRKDVKVVAFVQDKSSKIIGAAEAIVVE